MLHLQQPYVQRRTLNPEPLVAELVPTEAELLAADRERAAFKADQRWFAVSDHHALQLEVQRSRGAL